MNVAGLALVAIFDVGLVVFNNVVFHGFLYQYADTVGSDVDKTEIGWR